LSVVLYGYETWSLTLREERRFGVFENIVLRRVFGPMRDGVIGEWRKLHNEDLNVLYSSHNIVRVITSRIMRWAEHAARMGDRRVQGLPACSTVSQPTAPPLVCSVCEYVMYVRTYLCV
jgi:hypothetical protein